MKTLKSIFIILSIATIAFAGVQERSFKITEVSIDRVNNIVYVTSDRPGVWGEGNCSCYPNSPKFGMALNGTDIEKFYAAALTIINSTATNQLFMKIQYYNSYCIPYNGETVFTITRWSVVKTLAEPY